MTIIDRIKKVVFKYKKVQIGKIYEELSDCNKDVIRGTINRYVKREDREFERAEIGIYEVVEGKEDNIENLTDETLNSEIDMEEEITMYHASLDLNVGEKLFIPRVPKHRCEEEDDAIKRISVARNIKDAISGFPSKDYFVNTYKTYYKRNIDEKGNIVQDRFITVYELKAKRKDIVFSEDLEYLVPDSHLTKECWIMKETVGVGRIINVKNITLTGYNDYAWCYHGTVDKLEFEESKAINNYDLKTVVINKEDFEKLIELLNINNLEYKIVDKGRNKFYYTDFDAICGQTEEEYDWWEIVISVEKGFECAEVWKMIGKIDREYINIGAIHETFGAEYDEEEMEEMYLDSIVDYYLYDIIGNKYGIKYLNDLDESKYKEIFTKVKEKYISSRNDENNLKAEEELFEEIVIPLI